MTDIIDPDAIRQKQGNQPMLPFSGGDLDRSGIRLTRAEFARFLEVSKQAVTDWVKSGKVVLGADGRLDPRQAVSQLLRSTDPARLRSKVLAPLVKDVGKYQQRIADLESSQAAAKEAQEFAEDGVTELLALINSLQMRLRTEWEYLCALDSDTAMAAISAWLAEALMYGVNPSLEIISSGFPGDERDQESLAVLEKEMEGVKADTDALHAGWTGLDSETAAEIERAAAEFNQLESEARLTTETGAGVDG